MYLYNKMKRPDKTSILNYINNIILNLIYAYNCLINAYNRQNNIKGMMIQFECYIVKALNVIHIHFNQS